MAQANVRPIPYTDVVSDIPRHITTKDMMARYAISRRTAARWRRYLRDHNVLRPTSPKGLSTVGSLEAMDAAVMDMGSHLSPGISFSSESDNDG